MTEKVQLPPMVTLTGEAAHNALAAAVQMYQGVIADHVRQLSIAQSTVRACKAGEEAADRKIAELEKELKRRVASPMELAIAIPTPLFARLAKAIDLPDGEGISDENLVKEIERRLVKVGHGG